MTWRYGNVDRTSTLFMMFLLYSRFCWTFGQIQPSRLNQRARFLLLWFTIRLLLMSPLFPYYGNSRLRKSPKTVIIIKAFSITRVFVYHSYLDLSIRGVQRSPLEATGHPSAQLTSLSSLFCISKRISRAIMAPNSALYIKGYTDLSFKTDLSVPLSESILVR